MIDPRKEFPRKFVPQDADMGRWEDIWALGQALLSRQINSPQELERWLTDMDELTSCINEEAALRYIAMTCQTDDENREGRIFSSYKRLSRSGQN